MQTLGQLQLHGPQLRRYAMSSITGAAAEGRQLCCALGKAASRTSRYFHQLLHLLPILRALHQYTMCVRSVRTMRLHQR